MLYRENKKNKDKLSILGYGCMRFPADDSLAERQVITAIEQGVNYFDTAYIYGKSEVTLGKILAKGYRDRVKIATKLPPFMVKTNNDMYKILNQQLKRLQTDYIDYYLIHCLKDIDGWQRLVDLGIEEFIERSRKEGKIVNIGFSYHGGCEDFKKLIDSYDWDFCQIQYNYMDENSQAGKEGLMYASSKGLAVIIMEPLRGGLIASKMPKDIQAVWNSADTVKSPAGWALRWVWNHPEVTVVLSGMNVDSHIQENIQEANIAVANSLSEQELELFKKAKDILQKKLAVNCTGCNYCLPCPAGVDIPLCFSFYNSKRLFGGFMIKGQYIGFTSGLQGSKPSNASLCTGCGKCEKMCSQNIPIRKKLKEVTKEMEGFTYKIASLVIKLITRQKK